MTSKSHGLPDHRVVGSGVCVHLKDRGENVKTSLKKSETEVTASVLKKIQNTQEIRRTLSNWTKSMKSRRTLIKAMLLEKLDFIVYVLFRPIKKRSFNLLCVLDL